MSAFWLDKPTKVIGFITAVLGLVTAVLALLAQIGTFGDFRIPFLPGRGTGAAQGEVAIALSVGQGSSGTAVHVTGTGFQPQERITLRFHVDTIGNARADDDGAFAADATVPGTYDALGRQQYQIIATGDSSLRSAQAPFQLVPREGGGGGGGQEAAITLSPTKGPSGTKVTVTGRGFQAGESVQVYFHASPLEIVRADTGGAFTAVVTIPKTYDFSAPQKFSVSAVGKSSVHRGEALFELTKR